MEFIDGIVHLFKRFYPEEEPVLYLDSFHKIEGSKLKTDDLEFLIYKDTRLLEYFFCRNRVCAINRMSGVIHKKYKGITYCYAHTLFHWYKKRIDKARKELFSGNDYDLLVELRHVHQDLKHLNVLKEQIKKAIIIDNLIEELRGTGFHL